MTDLDEELAVRLAAALAVHKRRRRQREQARAQLAAARAKGKAIRHQQRLEQIGDTVGRPNLAARLAAERPCGCGWDRRCAQHWQLMTYQERAVWLATRGRGEQAPRGGDDAA